MKKKKNPLAYANYINGEIKMPAFTIQHLLESENPLTLFKVYCHDENKHQDLINALLGACEEDITDLCVSIFKEVRFKKVSKINIAISDGIEKTVSIPSDIERLINAVALIREKCIATDIKQQNCFFSIFDNYANAAILLQNLPNAGNPYLVIKELYHAKYANCRFLLNNTDNEFLSACNMALIERSSPAEYLKYLSLMGEEMAKSGLEKISEAQSHLNTEGIKTDLKELKDEAVLFCSRSATKLADFAKHYDCYGFFNRNNHESAPSTEANDRSNSILNTGSHPC